MIKYFVFTEIHGTVKKFYDLNQQQKCLICYLRLPILTSFKIKFVSMELF